MSKKTNTLLFIAGATIFNILVTIICFMALFVLFAWLLAPRLSPDATAWSLPIIFIGAIVLSFILYRLILKLLFKRVNADKYFDPIFGRRRK
ncbi:MAG: leader peptide processing enzyme [Spirochaetaceae bacterium]|nr:leader peptide processing enzyme [Spirochaetaceae bacterium]